MDSYDLSELIKKLWVDNCDKSSGNLTKPKNQIKICVWTDEGYREITNAKYNPRLKMIELELDNE